MLDTTTNPREQLLEYLHSEFDRVKNELREIQALIEQTDNEVERLQKKNTIVINRLHQIESNFDSVPRQDIRVAYNEAMDTRNRLLTLRGNLEKLQSDARQFEKYRDLIGRVLTLLEGVSPASMAGGSNGGLEVNTTAASIIRIIEAQEHERQALSQQLHDGPAQSLTNFILQAEICQRLFDRNPDRAAEELNNLKTVASATFQKVRDFIFDLRPMMLDDLGLVPTVRRYVDNYQEKNKIEITLHILGEDRRLESHREVVMFRTVQSLLNIARDHGKASKITITLDMGSEKITANVEDNGQGFNPDVILAEDSDGRASDPLGLKTLKERLELIGGEMDVHSEEGEGSDIKVILLAGPPLR